MLICGIGITTTFQQVHVTNVSLVQGFVVDYERSMIMLYAPTTCLTINATCFPPFFQIGNLIFKVGALSFTGDYQEASGCLNALMCCRSIYIYTMCVNIYSAYHLYSLEEQSCQLMLPTICKAFCCIFHLNIKLFLVWPD